MGVPLFYVLGWDRSTGYQLKTILRITQWEEDDDD